jgi:hypothetical protein
MSTPETGQRMNSEAPISPDLMTVLQLLRGAQN